MADLNDTYFVIDKLNFVPESVERVQNIPSRIILDDGSQYEVALCYLALTGKDQIAFRDLELKVTNMSSDEVSNFQFGDLYFFRENDLLVRMRDAVHGVLGGEDKDRGLFIEFYGSTPDEFRFKVRPGYRVEFSQSLADVLRLNRKTYENKTTKQDVIYSRPMNPVVADPKTIISVECDAAKRQYIHEYRTKPILAVFALPRIIDREILELIPPSRTYFPIDATTAGLQLSNLTVRVQNIVDSMRQQFTEYFAILHMRRKQ